MHKTHLFRLGATLSSSTLLIILISLTLGALAGPTASYAMEQPDQAHRPGTQAVARLPGDPGSEQIIEAAPTFSATALLTPTNGAVLTTTNSPRFQWQAASGEIISYTLLITGVTHSYPPFTSTTTAYTPTIALASGPYTWTVQAHNAAGETSGFVSPYIFTIDAVPGFGPSPLLTPTNGAVLSDSRPTLDWQEPVSGTVVSYTLRLTGPATETAVLATPASIYTVTQPLLSGPYSWTVQAHNAAGETSGFVSPYTFTIDAVPGFGPSPLLTPTNGAVLSEPRTAFSWLPASGPVLSYSLHITGPATALTYATAATSTTVTLSGNGAYTWTVQAHNAAGETSGPVVPPHTFSLSTTWAVYLPTVIKGLSCPTVSAAQFDLIPIEGPPADRPGPKHADLNLALRGYEETNEAGVLVGYSGATDPNAPQLAGLFNPDAYPGISSVYRVNGWDWGCGTPEGCPTGPITDWPVTLMGLTTTPGQPVAPARRAPDIYRGVYHSMVAYAEERRITLIYTRQDTVASGYAVHIENVCVDPTLLALYNDQTDAEGWHVTGRLPGLRNDEVLGTALGDEILVSIRDRGSFMDPRSQKDWWAGYPVGLEIQRTHDTLSNKLEAPRDLK